MDSVDAYVLTDKVRQTESILCPLSIVQCLLIQQLAARLNFQLTNPLSILCFFVVCICACTDLQCIMNMLRIPVRNCAQSHPLAHCVHTLYKLCPSTNDALVTYVRSHQFSYAQIEHSYFYSSGALRFVILSTLRVLLQHCITHLCLVWYVGFKCYICVRACVQRVVTISFYSLQNALHMRATRTFNDKSGVKRKNGEEWLIKMEDTEAHIPDVYEEVSSIRVPWGLHYRHLLSYCDYTRIAYFDISLRHTILSHIRQRRELVGMLANSFKPT